MFSDRNRFWREAIPSRWTQAQEKSCATPKRSKPAKSLEPASKRARFRARSRINYFASGVKAIPRKAISGLAAWAIVVTGADTPVSSTRTTRFEFTLPL